jgi:hypothetical protein
LGGYFLISTLFNVADSVTEVNESTFSVYTIGLRRATFKECHNLFEEVKIKKTDNKFKFDEREREAFDKLDKIVRKYFSCVSFMFGFSDENSGISCLPNDVVKLILQMAAEPS